MHLKNSSPSLFPFAAELTCCSRDRDLGGLCHGLGSDVGHPQWDLQDVSGREQQELLMIPQDWIPKWLLSEDPNTENPELGISGHQKWWVPVFLYLYGPPLPFSNPLLLLPGPAPLPEVPAPIQPSPTPTEFMLPLVSPPALCDTRRLLCLLEHPKSVGNSRILSVLREHRTGLDMRCWISSRKSQSWVQVCVA